MNIDFIRKTVQKWPGVTEDIKWGHDLVFSVGLKMFCVVGLSESPTNASFKVNEEEYEEMSVRPGFRPAPYMARNKWVLAEDISKINKKDWEAYLRQSYELVRDKLPKKLISRLAD